ncbi:MAG TPA: hypothetical protein VJI46_05145 [Candidatus Nanoarchaeia archaeon]|nr:hypothetical protein [Candidatus Nanoarchaeia archaeon]
MAVGLSMELDEYLTRINNCPDKDVRFGGRKLPLITVEFGVTANWAILLNADYDAVAKLLQERDFILIQSIDGSMNDGKRFSIFDYEPGTVKLELNDHVRPGYVTHEVQDIEHHERQIRDFNVSMMLWPYLEKQIPNTTWERALVRVITGIAELAKQNHFSLCFPNSVGCKDSRDYSRIVYYTPTR